MAYSAEREDGRWFFPIYIVIRGRDALINGEFHEMFVNRIRCRKSLMLRDLIYAYLIGEGCWILEYHLRRLLLVLCSEWYDKMAQLLKELICKRDDVFEAKADVSALLQILGQNPDNVQVTRDAPDYYHPGKSGTF